MTKNAKEVIAEIRKLIFGEAQPEVAPVESLEAHSEPNAPEAVELASQEPEAVESPEIAPQPSQEFGSIEDQLLNLRKQVEVLSEFAQLKQQVDYLSGWAKGQMSVNENYKAAFEQLLPVVEAMADSPTADPVHTPREKYSEVLNAASKDRAANFLTSIRAARAAQK